MAHDMTPTTMLRENLRFWMRLCQMQSDMMLTWWKALGLLPPPAIDPDVQKVCEEAAHPRDVPDPVPAAPAPDKPKPRRAAPRRATPRRAAKPAAKPA